MGCRPGLSSLAGTRVAWLALACSLVAACGKRPLVEMDASAGTGGLVGAAGAPGAGGVGAAGGASGGDGRCGGGQGGTFPPQCTDGLDNDGDGKIDYDDPECTGGHDNDESSFAWGIPGDDGDPCTSDCFFDGNSGSGDDGCNWKRRCDPASTAPSCPYDPAYAATYPDRCSLTSSQTQGCVDRCRKIIPNGCDCFGCCTIPGLAGPVLLQPSCTAADFADPQKCAPCTQVTQCLNPCERCELCIGKPTLPADCATPDAGAPYDCPATGIACGAYGIAPACCPAGTSCVTGCCLPLDPLL
jgi:hypothetical protein